MKNPIEHLGETINENHCAVGGSVSSLRAYAQALNKLGMMPDVANHLVIISRTMERCNVALMDAWDEVLTELNGLTPEEENDGNDLA